MPTHETSKPSKSLREHYASNRLVRFCANGTAVLVFVGMVWQGGAWATEKINERFARTSDVRSLQKGQSDALTEQRQQRGILERQTRQLDFIYYDSMKRELSNLQKEIFRLRSRTNRSGVEQARLDQLLEDFRDMKVRVRQQEARIRGQRP